MDDFETVRFGLKYGRMTSDPLAALDRIEARVQELEGENKSLREDGIMGRDTAYRRRDAADARVQKLEAALERRERAYKERVQRVLVLEARVKELEAELASDRDTRESSRVLEARVRELEAEQAQYGKKAYEHLREQVEQANARFTDSFKTVERLIREKERLRETLRDIYDCADDWNRVEDLASGALAELAEQEPAT